ncbi:unnamed protein product [Cunninghamella echinulata]
MKKDHIGILHTFKLSHFSEKARWALDYCNVPYVEKCHVPVLHRLTFLMNFFFSVTVPLFVPHQKGYPRTLPESAQIVQYANDNSRNNKKLLPENQDLVKEIHALEKIFDIQFGPSMAQFVYYHIIDNKSIIYKLIGAGIEPGIQTFILNHGHYPEQLPTYFEVKDMYPQEAENIIMKYHESVAGQFALRIYKDHRYEKLSFQNEYF